MGSQSERTTNIRVSKETLTRINKLVKYGTWDDKINQIADLIEQYEQQKNNTNKGEP